MSGGGKGGPHPVLIARSVFAARHRFPSEGRKFRSSRISTPLYLCALVLLPASPPTLTHARPCPCRSVCCFCASCSSFNTLASGAEVLLYIRLHYVVIPAARLLSLVTQRNYCDAAQATMS